MSSSPGHAQDSLPELHPPRLHAAHNASHGFAYWILFCFLICVGGILVWLWRRQKPRSRPSPSPAQEALAALKRLRETAENSSRRIEILHILTRFLEQTTGLSPAARTSHELIGALRSAAILNPQQLESAHQILRECDRQLFSNTVETGGWSPLLSQAEALVNSIAAPAPGSLAGHAPKGEPRCP